MEKKNEYEWETCVVCGKSEETYYAETGFAMLIWHTNTGAMCEECYENFDENEVKNDL